MASAAVGRLGTWGVHLRYPFPLARCIWLTIRRPFTNREWDGAKIAQACPNISQFQKRQSAYFRSLKLWIAGSGFLWSLWSDGYSSLTDFCPTEYFTNLEPQNPPSDVFKLLFRRIPFPPNWWAWRGPRECASWGADLDLRARIVGKENERDGEHQNSEAEAYRTVR